MSHLTRREWAAINAALARVLADDNEPDVDLEAMKRIYADRKSS